MTSGFYLDRRVQRLIIAGTISSDCVFKTSVWRPINLEMIMTSWTITMHPDNGFRVFVEFRNRVTGGQSNTRFVRDVRIRTVKGYRVVNTHLAGAHHQIDWCIVVWGNSRNPTGEIILRPANRRYFGSGQRFESR